jgi:hypothetical protein
MYKFLVSVNTDRHQRCLIFFISQMVSDWIAVIKDRLWAGTINYFCSSVSLEKTKSTSTWLAWVEAPLVSMACLVEILPPLTSSNMYCSSTVHQSHFLSPLSFSPIIGEALNFSFPTPTTGKTKTSVGQRPMEKEFYYRFWVNFRQPKFLDES